MKSQDYACLELNPTSMEDKDKLFNEAIPPNIFGPYYNDIRDTLEANYDYFMTDGSEIIIYPKYVTDSGITTIETGLYLLKDEEGTNSLIMDAIFSTEDQFSFKYGKLSIIYFANRKGNLSMGEIYPPDNEIFTTIHLARIIMKEEDYNDTDESRAFIGNNVGD